MINKAENLTRDLADEPRLLRTPLFDLHIELGAKMVAFAGYEMPVQYKLGVLGEHLHTRRKAGLFDVSHMGQVRLIPCKTDDDAAEIFERLVPGGLKNLQEGCLRYTQLTNDEGGILDDLMVTRFGNTLWLVVNAVCKKNDYRHISKKLASKLNIEIAERGLISLQGPKASKVLARLFPEVEKMAFMSALQVMWQATEVLISRCGYTGEDGYEISLPNELTTPFTKKLLKHEDVEMVGLGARDSLRLEAGLCLYGHDIDTATTPAQANLLWSIPSRRRREANFPGAAIINQKIADGADRKLVGILPKGRAPAREGTKIQSLDGQIIGVVTSGGFGPSVNGPIAMGYVAKEFTATETRLNLIVRGKALLAKVVALPFVQQRYYRG